MKLQKQKAIREGWPFAFWDYGRHFSKGLLLQPRLEPELEHISRRTDPMDQPKD